MSNIIKVLKARITGKALKIVFPESEDIRILEAVEKLSKEGLVKPILIGDPNKISKEYDLTGCTIINPYDCEIYDEMVESFVDRRKGRATIEMAKELMLDMNYFGTMLVYMGLADGLVSGATRSTGETVRPALQIIKTKPGISRTFGYFLMVRDEYKFIFGDCAINGNPTAEMLAEFAIESAKAAEMFGIEPKVALLSFSTNGSADTKESRKVKLATKLAKEKNSGYIIDGEMQGNVLQERLRKIVDSSDDDGNVPLQVITPDLQDDGIMLNLSMPAHQETLEPHLEGIDLIVVDNIATLCRSGRENESDSWASMQQWALRQRARGKSVLFVHHAGKSGAQRGTSSREDALDTVISLSRPEGYSSDSGAVFEVHYEKSRNFFGCDAESFQAALMEDDDGRSIWKISGATESLFDRAVALARENHGSQKEIARKLRTSEGNLSKLLARARDEGLLPA